MICIVWFWNFFVPIFHTMRGPHIQVIFFEDFPFNMFFGAQSKETVTFTPTKRLQMCLWAISWGVCGYVYSYLVQCLDNQQKLELYEQYNKVGKLVQIMKRNSHFLWVHSIKIFWNSDHHFFRLLHSSAAVCPSRYLMN